MLNNPYQAYQKTQVATASQGKLILMVFDAAIKFSRAALSGITEENFQQCNTNIIKAQDIISELMISLDIESGGEIASNLTLIYDYIYRQLVEANVKKDVQILERVIDMLVDLRQTWEEVIKLSRKSGPTIQPESEISDT